ncbi:chemotaxis protein CheW [bacterium]|nr:chemotaxis protein CheW [bacterium]
MLVVCCRVGDSLWGFDARDVETVVPSVALRPVPAAPAPVAGLLRFHGRLVPVLDLGVLAGGEPSREALGTRILVLRRPRGPVGLRAERVVDTVEIDPSRLATPPIDSPGARWLGGIAAEGGESLQLVRPSGLLPPEIEALLDAAAAGEPA